EQQLKQPRLRHLVARRVVDGKGRDEPDECRPRAAGDLAKLVRSKLVRERPECGGERGVRKILPSELDAVARKHGPAALAGQRRRRAGAGRSGATLTRRRAAARRCISSTWACAA